MVTFKWSSIDQALLPALSGVVLAPRTQRRSQNFRSDVAKIRLSEGKTKENLVFFCFSERKYLRRSQRYTFLLNNPSIFEFFSME